MTCDVCGFPLHGGPLQHASPAITAACYGIALKEAVEVLRARAEMQHPNHEEKARRMRGAADMLEREANGITNVIREAVNTTV